LKFFFYFFYKFIKLIAPEEILDPAVDEQSVMTYLSLFPKARLKPGAPLKPKKGLALYKTPSV